MVWISGDFCLTYSELLDSIDSCPLKTSDFNYFFKFVLASASFYSSTKNRSSDIVPPVPENLSFFISIYLFIHSAYLFYVVPTGYFYFISPLFCCYWLISAVLSSGSQILSSVPSLYHLIMIINVTRLRDYWRNDCLVRTITSSMREPIDESIAEWLLGVGAQLEEVSHGNVTLWTISRSLLTSPQGFLASMS